MMKTIGNTAYLELATCVADALAAFLDGLPADPGDLLIDRMRHACFPTGKLVRPTLFAASAGLCGRDPREVVAVAVGLEIGHTASLVHDDIIDRDPIRRGRESVWSRYGADSAILTGDALFFALFRAVADTGADPFATVEAVRAIAEVGHELCLGQSMEAEATRTADLSWNTYHRVIYLKSASYIRLCTELGAVLAGATPEQRALLRGFGEDLGMAFQMQDDVLAYVSTLDTAGKDPLSDIRSRRASLPVVIANELGSDAERALLQRYFAADALTTGEEEALIALFGSEPVLKQAGTLAADRLDSAIQALTTFPDSGYLAVLRDITSALEGRQW
jgi:geranylgeranyl diphosphate synthase type I